MYNSGKVLWQRGRIRSGCRCRDIHSCLRNIFCFAETNIIEYGTTLATKVEIRVEISYQQQIIMHGEVGSYERSRFIACCARIAVVGEKDGGICIYMEFKMKVIPHLLPKTFPLQTPCRWNVCNFGRWWITGMWVESQHLTVKCKCYWNSVTLLGHTISSEGITPIKEELQLSLKPPIYRTRHNINPFWRTYNVKFLPDIPTVHYPLYKLLISGHDHLSNHLPGRRNCFVRLQFLNTTTVNNLSKDLLWWLPIWVGSMFDAHHVKGQ